MNIPKTAVRNFITYFIVFSIPVISLVFFTHTQLIKKFQTTTYNLELSYQNNKLNDFEQNINKLIDIASQIKISETELNENIMSRIDLIDQLRYCKALNNTLEEIILYFPDSSPRILLRLYLVRLSPPHFQVYPKTNGMPRD